MNVIILKNGPILIDGPAVYRGGEATEFDELKGDKIALCRCANSDNKPFCDGSHKNCDFNEEQSEIITD